MNCFLAVFFIKYLERHSLVAALSDMVPVRARRQINYPADVLGENMPSERVLKEQEHYALNHINRKLVLEPKVSTQSQLFYLCVFSTWIHVLHHVKQTISASMEDHPNVMHFTSPVLAIHLFIWRGF